MKNYNWLNQKTDENKTIDNDIFKQIRLSKKESYYISPQINRAEKNKSYFYNCYGKEEKFYIENQG